MKLVDFAIIISRIIGTVPTQDPLIETQENTVLILFPEKVTPVQHDMLTVGQGLKYSESEKYYYFFI